MVVLSVAILTKSGKALLSRQYVEMTRLRVEGLLNAFPKLVASETNTASKQHTFVETENVRYVYLPLDSSLYLLLVTNKGSNIVEDLDTLRLLSRVIPDQLGVGVPMTDISISAKAFELLSDFDEVLTVGGNREDANLQQVRTYREMESHEEKLADMIKQSKMAEAKEASKRKAQELRAKHDADAKAARASGGGSGGGPSRFGGFGGSGNGGGDEGMSRVGGSGTGSSSRGGGGGGGGDRDRESSSSSSSKQNWDTAEAGGGGGSSAATKSGGGSSKASSAAGMKLGAKKSGLGGLMSSGAAAGVMAEEGIRDKDLEEMMGGGGGGGGGGAAGAASAVAAAKAAAEAASADQASVVVEEKVVVRLSRDGGLNGMEVKGSMTLTVGDEGAGQLRIVTEGGHDDASKAFQYQSHPNVNKPLFTAGGLVGLKAADRAFPTASPVGVLRWRYTNKDDDISQVPLTLTCWPEEGAGGVVNVNLEYTLQFEHLTLTDVVVAVPLGGDVVPNVRSCDGSWKHNTRENTLLWRIDTLNADNANGTLEFSIKGKNTDAFFPVRVNFASAETLCPIRVASIIPADGAPGDKPLRYSVATSLTVEEYVIE